MPLNVDGRVCSKHFLPSEFEIKDDGRRYLKAEAFPKNFLSSPVAEDAATTYDQTERGELDVMEKNDGIETDGDDCITMYEERFMYSNDIETNGDEWITIDEEPIAMDVNKIVYSITIHLVIISLLLSYY